jgi:hypothetical protein
MRPDGSVCVCRATEMGAKTAENLVKKEKHEEVKLEDTKDDKKVEL